MLKRKIWSKLEDFKANANKKTLLLTGARQVGKTYIVDYVKRIEIAIVCKIEHDF